MAQARIPLSPHPLCPGHGTILTVSPGALSEPQRQQFCWELARFCQRLPPAGAVAFFPVERIQGVLFGIIRTMEEELAERGWKPKVQKVFSCGMVGKLKREQLGLCCDSNAVVLAYIGHLYADASKAQNACGCGRQRSIVSPGT